MGHKEMQATELETRNLAGVGAGNAFGRDMERGSAEYAAKKDSVIVNVHSQGGRRLLSPIEYFLLRRVLGG
jgi:hypothetical protein